MIVQCKSCETRFQLDEARIPRDGVRVRCSRCKESFFLAHPSATPQQVADEIVGATTVSGGSQMPDATDDLSPPPSPPATEPAGPRSGVDIGEDDEDWEFDTDLPAGDEAGEGDDGGSFGTADDFSSLMDEDLDLADPDLSTELELDPVAERISPVSAKDDLGDPEDWNFLSDDPQETPVAKPSPTRVEPALALSTPQTPRDDSTPDIHSVSRAEAGFIRRAGRGLGWIVTGTLLAAGLARGLVPSAQSGAGEVNLVELGSLRAEEVRGQWVETLHSGVVFAVSGVLKNPGTAPVAAGAALQVSLLAQDGSALTLAPASIGLAPLESALREATPSVRRAAQARAAEALSWRPIEPGEGIAFLAILEDVPSRAVSFRIESASASRPLDPSAIEDESGDEDAFGLSGSDSARLRSEAISGAEVRSLADRRP